MRTGRVNQQYRAVLFRLDGRPTARLTSSSASGTTTRPSPEPRSPSSPLNPVNGITEVRIGRDSRPRRRLRPLAGIASAPPSERPPGRAGLHRSPSCVDGLGLDADWPRGRPLATSEDELLDLAERAYEWQGIALLDLAAGAALDEVKAKLGSDRSRSALADRATSGWPTGYEHPAAQLTFTYIEDNDELRRVIEGGDLDAWRVFLHPEQRTYAERDTTARSGCPAEPARARPWCSCTGRRRWPSATRRPGSCSPPSRPTSRASSSADLARLDPTCRRASGQLGTAGVSVTRDRRPGQRGPAARRPTLDADCERVLGARGRA